VHCRLYCNLKSVSVCRGITGVVLLQTIGLNICRQHGLDIIPINVASNKQEKKRKCRESEFQLNTLLVIMKKYDRNISVARGLKNSSLHARCSVTLICATFGADLFNKITSRKTELVYNVAPF